MAPTASACMHHHPMRTATPSESKPFSLCAQFVLSLVLIALGSSHLLNPDGTCALGGNEHHSHGLTLCDIISGLGLISLCSALILSVMQVGGYVCLPYLSKETNRVPEVSPSSAAAP